MTKEEVILVHYKWSDGKSSAAKLYYFHDGYYAGQWCYDLGYGNGVQPVGEEYNVALKKTKTAIRRMVRSQVKYDEIPYCDPFR